MEGMESRESRVESVEQRRAQQSKHRGKECRKERMKRRESRVDEKRRAPRIPAPPPTAPRRLGWSIYTALYRCYGFMPLNHIHNLYTPDTYHAFSSTLAFFRSSLTSAAASCSCFSSASALPLISFSCAGFFAASVARLPFVLAAVASSSSRAISSLAFLMF